VAVASAMGALGLAMAVVTYILTVTFLFTTPGWEAGYGAPVVGRMRQFLLKDLGLMAGALLLLAQSGGRGNRRSAIESSAGHDVFLQQW